MNYWIFQGNPKIFDVNKYITQNKHIRWSVRQKHYLDKISIGDEVFIWRSEAGSKGTGGVIAKAKVIPHEKYRGENDVSDYYFDKTDSGDFEYISLEVIECRIYKGFIERQSLLEHEILKNLRVLKMRNETNFKLPDELATELNGLWESMSDAYYFPVLKPVKRDREFKKYPEQLRDQVIFEYLVNGKSNRWIDENVLGEDPQYSRGWFSMGILHHIGLVDQHKGFFLTMSANDTIQYLTNTDNEKLGILIVSLMRYTQNIYDDESLNWFTPPEKVKRLFKKVGTSQYTDGVRIDKDFHDVFNPKNTSFYVERGTARPIKVLFNNKVFEAEYRFEDQEDKSLQLQSIRFKKELKKEFKRVFPIPEGEFFIEQGQDLNHFVFSHQSISIFDTVDDEEVEYAEGKEYYRLHRLRERKPALINEAKKKFVMKHGRLFCEVCNVDFSQMYGERGNDFIEGHHKRLVSELKEGEKTIVEDIAMLCSNCHRMIHRKPLISVEDLRAIVLQQKQEYTNREV